MFNNRGIDPVVGFTIERDVLARKTRNGSFFFSPGLSTHIGGFFFSLCLYGVLILHSLNAMEA